MLAVLAHGGQDLPAALTLGTLGGLHIDLDLRPGGHTHLGDDQQVLLPIFFSFRAASSAPFTASRTFTSSSQTAIAAPSSA